MSESEILLEVSAEIATVTLNRPAKLNALNAAVLRQLGATLADLAAREDIRAVILTGAGEKAFAAGADIAELAALDPVAAHRHALLGQAVFEQLEAMPVPVIAAVNGFALGGGCELCMAAHVRIAADTASFGQPEVNLGLIPGFAGTQRLARIIGRARALEMILTGRRIKADEALQVGLVSRILPAAELAGAARDLATDIAAKAPLAIRYALDAVRRGQESGFDEGSRYEATLFGLLFSTSDMQEGTKAFLEKRPAKFTGQ